jgi:hypothetical protein
MVNQGATLRIAGKPRRFDDLRGSFLIGWYAAEDDIRNHFFL